MVTLPLGLDPLLTNPLNVVNPLIMFPTYSNTPNLSKVLYLLQIRDQLQKQATSLELFKAHSKQPSFVNKSFHKLVEVPYETHKQEEFNKSSLLKFSGYPNLLLEAQVSQILDFFIENFGIIEDQELYKEKMNYSQNPKLIKLFDTLQAKYSTSTKTKEELTKWIIRRTLKTGKQTEKEIHHLNIKRVLFENSKESQEVSFKLDYESESIHSQWIESVLPFKKNSKNKSMNSHFLAEIFGSDKFRRDYVIFLRNFDLVMEEDTIEKKKRFINFIIECMKQNTFEKILKYRRVPWLKVWVQNTKKVAEELRAKSNKQMACKQIKRTS